MMRRLTLILLLLIFGQVLRANSIDALKTDEDVAVFLNKIIKGSPEKKAKELKILSLDSLKRSLGSCYAFFTNVEFRSWEKADFNNDGNTDLIVMPSWYGLEVYVVMDNGDDSFKMSPVSNDVALSCVMAKPFKMGDQQLLALYSRREVSATASVRKVDTLIYKYGGFIELNTMPANYRIKMISYTTNHCFGSCPVFSIDIYADGYARYMAVDHNPTTGDFETQMHEESFEELMKLINYLDIKKLKDNYAVSYTDSQTAFLKIQFRDGTTKNIKDYGLAGSFGLTRLFQVLSDLRLNQEWQ